MEHLEQSLVFPWVVMLFFLIVAGFWSLAYTLKALRSKDRNPQPPGPPGLPILGHLHLLGDLPHRTLSKLAQKYGPIMQLRLGLVPTIVVSSPEAAQLFLKTHDLNFVNRPKIQAGEYVGYGSKGVGTSEYGPYWRNMRKLCTVHLLSLSKIESFSCLRKEEIRDLINSIKEPREGCEVVNISAPVGSAIEKISYNMIFGSGYQEKFDFKPCVQEGLVLAGTFNIADYVPFLKAFDFQGLTRRLKDVSRVMDGYLEKIIDDHEQDTIGQEDHPRDFIDVMLLLSKSGEEKLEKTSIKAITLDMLAASMDTSATTIEWALTELLRHPQVMKQVQEELVAVIGLDRAVEETDLENLAYLNLVVKETMRLHPAAPLLIPHESIEDISLGGYHIPKKSRIIINAWQIGRDPIAWPDKTEEFYPERFIGTDIDVRGHDMQLIPFGSGRRKCPGIELGLRTVHLVLAQLVHCFNLELPKGMEPSEVNMDEKLGLTVPRANPLLVIPTYRLHDNTI